MANILVYIELENGRASQASLGLLGGGRCIASELGAVLCAVLPCAEPPSYDENDIIAVLSRHGADKVILLAHPQIGGDGPIALRSEALVHACERFRPRLLLLSASEEGSELGPRLALKLQGQFCDMERLGVEGVSVENDLPGSRCRALDSLLRCEESLIMTLRDGGTPRATGQDEAEVVVLRPPLAGASTAPG